MSNEERTTNTTTSNTEVNDEYIPTTYSLEYIDIDKLKPSPLNSFEICDIQDLAGSIKMCGLMTPLTVVGPDEDGMYEILGGERRYQAIKYLNENGEEFNKIPCNVDNYKEMHNLLKELKIEASNVEARDFDRNAHMFKIIKIIKGMADSGIISHRHIVKEAKKYMQGSDRYKRMYLQIFKNGDEELQNLVEENKITVAHASRIASIDKESQKVAIDALNAGVKSKDIVDAITDVNKTNNKRKTREENEADFDDALLEEVMNLDENDDSIDIESYCSRFTELINDVDLNRDTTNEYKKMVSEGESSKNMAAEDDERAKKVTKWCNRMMKKDAVDYTQAELEAIDAMKEFLDYIGEI